MSVDGEGHFPPPVKDKPEGGRHAQVGVRPAVVSALQMHGLHRKMEKNYITLLEEMVFCNNPSVDVKTKLSSQKCLKKPTARILLDILWKESCRISDEELAMAGSGRFFETDTLTAHRLASSICTKPSELAKTNANLRVVAIAASNYGLVEREPYYCTKKVLRGTDLLHDFMMSLAKENCRLIEGVLFANGALESRDD